MRLRTLRGLGAAFVGFFVATVIVVGLSIYAATHATLDREVDRRLASTAAAIIPDGTRPALSVIVARIAVLERQRESRDLGFMLLDRGGRQVAGTIHIVLPPPGFSAIDRDDHIPGLVRGRALVVPAGKDHVLTLLGESEPIDGFDSTFIRVLILGMSAIAAMVVIGVIALTGAIGRRMADLRDAVSTIVDGDMDRRVRVDGSGSEFDNQAHMVNRMLDRIQELMSAVRHIAHDAAHELRTPLARLRGKLAAIARRADGGPLQSDIEEALQHTDDTLGLCTAILRIAEIDEGGARAGFQAVDLSMLIQDIVAAYLPDIEEQGRACLVTGGAGATVQGDPQLLNQLFANLIENWLAHTRAGVGATLSIVPHEDRVRITFADRGTGILKGDWELAIRRFGRLDGSEARGGHGLGLPLVAAIARLHRADLTLGDAGPGLAVTLDFPYQRS